MATKNHLVTHDKNWIKSYETEKAAVYKPLKNWIFEIAYIGSTAVPELMANPTIDIMMGAVDLEVAEIFCTDILESMGYEYIEKYEKLVPERRFFRKVDKQGNHFNIHLVQYNSKFWNNALLHRDFLRTHPDTRKEYEALKKQLSTANVDDMEYHKQKIAFWKALEKRLKK